MTHLPVQVALPTVGDTIWVTRTVDLPAGRSLRAADWDASDPVELLGPARVTLRGGSADVSYPIAIWRAGFHTLQVPGPLLLSVNGGVDSLRPEAVTLRVASVLPRPATDTSLRPQPRAEFVPRAATTPLPLVLFLILAVAIGLPDAPPSLDTDSVLAKVAEKRPDWPLSELAEILRGLDDARFGNGTLPDAMGLARWAAELEPRLQREAA